MSAPVNVLAGPLRVVQEFVRGRNLPIYIIVGKGGLAMRYASGRRVTFNSEAAALARVKGQSLDS